jgi:hypothetical protein
MVSQQQAPEQLADVHMMEPAPVEALPHQQQAEEKPQSPLLSNNPSNAKGSTEKAAHVDASRS